MCVCVCLFVYVCAVCVRVRERRNVYVCVFCHSVFVETINVLLCDNVAHHSVIFTTQEDNLQSSRDMIGLTIIPPKWYSSSTVQLEGF